MIIMPLQIISIDRDMQRLGMGSGMAGIGGGSDNSICKYLCKIVSGPVSYLI